MAVRDELIQRLTTSIQNHDYTDDDRVQAQESFLPGIRDVVYSWLIAHGSDFSDLAPDSLAERWWRETES
jgi:hypothetical protein